MSDVETPASEPVEETPEAAAPVEQVREVIASPSRNADGSVTHSADAEIPDPDGYAEAAAAQLANLGVDEEHAVELARSEANRGGQAIETADAPPAGEQA